MNTRVVMGIFLCCLLRVAAIAGEQAEPAVAPDQALLKQIAALPDNRWLKLPPVKTAGDLSWLSPNSDYRRQGPRIRDYCNKMVWAPERKRALYCGAGHNIHPLNDVWEYDLASNTWICLFAADPAASRQRDAAWYREHVVLRDGVVLTPRDAPLRPAHTWWGLCYDTHRRRLVFWDAHKGLLFTNRNLIAAALKLDPQAPLLQGSGSGPGEAWVFEFDPASKTWIDTMQNVPKAYESSQLEYLPKQQTLWLHSGRTHLLDSTRQTWQPVSEPFNSNGALSAYDPESNKVVLVRGSTTRVYDCDKQTWAVTVQEGPDTVRIPSGTFCYDSAAKKFVLFTNAKGPDKSQTGSRLWLYDLPTNKWSNPHPSGGCPQLKAVASYYDPTRNVTVIHSNHETWVYRADQK